MNKYSMPVVAFGVTIIVAGCTRDYTPESSATGEAIYKAACSECHQAEDPKSPDIYFTLNSKNANANYIAHRVHTGTFMMPKFPNIKGSKMRALSSYVLDHSTRN